MPQVPASSNKKFSKLEFGKINNKLSMNVIKRYLVKNHLDCLILLNFMHKIYFATLNNPKYAQP